MQEREEMVEAVARIPNNLDDKPDATNRVVYYSNLGFYIETEEVTYMESEDGSYHSFTFQVVRDSPESKIENLVFSFQQDSTYKIKLFTYDVSSEEKETILSGSYVNLDGKVTKQELKEVEENGELELKMDVGCADVYFPYCTQGADHSDGSPCGYIAYGIITICSGGGGDGGGTENPDNSNLPDGGGGSSGSGSPANTNNDATSPTVNIPYEQDLIDCLNTDDFTILEWINNPDNFNQMRDASSLCSADATNQDFISEAIEAILEHDDVDFNDIIYVLENEQDYTNWMSDDEKNLFDTLTRTEQLLYLASAKQAKDETEDIYITFCELYNGKGDAFRHAYWNALSSSRIGVGLTNLLTTRHENQPATYPYNSKVNEMDLFNNQIGRDLITNGSTDILQDVIITLNNGDLRYLSDLSNVIGHECEATFNSQLIPTNQ